MSPVNLIWVTYKDSMNITYFGAIHKKVTFQEGTSTNSQVTKNKNKSKPKAVEKEAFVKTVFERPSKRVSKKVTKELSQKSNNVSSKQPLENAVDKQIEKSDMVDFTSEVVPLKPKKIKKKVKSRRENYDVVDPKMNKRKVVGVLK